jgi:hypothetical protein
MHKGVLKVADDPNALSTNGVFTPALPAIVFITPDDSSNMRIV